jgi:hypothetical protein|tara:strand:- start:183 stop:365 length:183 start_codon:yes stop_codon:yes gene_type:complete
MDYATTDYREFFIHKSPTESGDDTPRIIMRTLDGYVIFGKDRQDELRKLLNQIEMEHACV